MDIQSKIVSEIATMSVEELKERLTRYMLADESQKKRIVAIEVRSQVPSDRCGRYQVLLIQEDGTETEVKFRDRYSRLIYIYTLLHPEGYQRRMLKSNNYQSLRQLYSKIYLKSAESLLKTIGDDYEHFFSQAVAQSRVAIRNACPFASDCIIAQPQKYNGKTIIPFAVNSNHVILDNSLSI